MSIDSEQDLVGLRRIGRIVGATLREMGAQVRPGMTTAELDALGEALLKKHGARPAPRLTYNFPGATCISLNDEAAHGIPGERVIRAGDLVNIDVSAELDGYFADTGATIPVPPVSAATRRLCASTRAALNRAIAAARAGHPMSVIRNAVAAEARRGGFTIIRNLGGHGVGRGLHEPPDHVPNYYLREDKRRLSPGLVITIEPFLSTGAQHVVEAGDGWTLKTTGGKLVAQYEHTVVITRGRPIVVTAV